MITVEIVVKKNVGLEGKLKALLSTPRPYTTNKSNLYIDIISQDVNDNDGIIDDDLYMELQLNTKVGDIIWWSAGKYGSDTPPPLVH